jgi:hypothetical protein
MASEYALTWAELDTTATWQDVDYSNVPKLKTKWQSDLTYLVEDLESIPIVGQGHDND